MLTKMPDHRANQSACLKEHSVYGAFSSLLSGLVRPQRIIGLERRKCWHHAQFTAGQARRRGDAVHAEGIEIAIGRGEIDDTIRNGWRSVAVGRSTCSPQDRAVGFIERI